MPVKGEGIRDAKPLHHDKAGGINEGGILTQMERLGRFYLQRACPNTSGSEAAPTMQVRAIKEHYLTGILTGSSNDLSLLLLAFSLDEWPEVLSSWTMAQHPPQ